MEQVILFLIGALFGFILTKMLTKKEVVKATPKKRGGVNFQDLKEADKIDKDDQFRFDN